MENSKDGGPAFPYGEDDWDGMSLRDYFAAKSLAGNLDYFLNLKLKRGIVAKEIADFAYIIADAMIARRGPKS